LTTETIVKTDMRFPADVQHAVKDVGNEENYVKTLKGIMDDVEQIHEISQSLNAVSREIVEELIKVLQVNNKVLRLENFEGGKEVVVHPKGFVLIRDKIRDKDENTEPRLLTDLEPPLLHAILKKLIPKLKASLDDRKQSKESLLEELIRIRDSFV